MSKAPVDTSPANPSTPSTSAPPPFQFPHYASFPPFYTLQPNLTTRARQLELWSDLVLAYCAHHRIFRLSLSSPPPDLFRHPQGLARSLRADDVRTVLEHMSQASSQQHQHQHQGGPRVEWIPSTTSCYVYWRTPGDWADALAGWVEETGQKGAVLTLYELREGEAARGRAWEGIDEAVLRKAINVLVKRGKAQVFGQEESAGVKFF